MCSGLGIPMVAWMTLFALMLRGWRIALAVGAVPTLVYAAWYSAYGVSATEQADQLPDASASAFLAYVWAGISHVWDVTTGMPQVGMTVFLGLAATAFLVRTTDKLHALAVSGRGDDPVRLHDAGGLAGRVRRRAGHLAALRAARPHPHPPRVRHRDRHGEGAAAGPHHREGRPSGSASRRSCSSSSYASTRTFADNRATFFAGARGAGPRSACTSRRAASRCCGPTLEAANQPPIDVALLSEPGQRDHVPSVDPDDDELWLARAQFRVGATPTPGDLPFAHSVTGAGIGGDLDLSDCADGGDQHPARGVRRGPRRSAGHPDRPAQSWHERDRPAGARRRGVGAGAVEHPGGSDGVRRDERARRRAAHHTDHSTFGVCDHG